MQLGIKFWMNKKLLPADTSGILHAEWSKVMTTTCLAFQSTWILHLVPNLVKKSRNIEWSLKYLWSMLNVYRTVCMQTEHVGQGNKCTVWGHDLQQLCVPSIRASLHYIRLKIFQFFILQCIALLKHRRYRCILITLYWWSSGCTQWGGFSLCIYLGQHIPDATAI